MLRPPPVPPGPNASVESAERWPPCSAGPPIYAPEALQHLEKPPESDDRPKQGENQPTVRVSAEPPIDPPAQYGPTDDRSGELECDGNSPGVSPDGSLVRHLTSSPPGPAGRRRSA